MSGGGTKTTTALTLHWPIELQQSSPPGAAVEKTAVKPPWKTLRVSHFSPARRRLGSQQTETPPQSGCLRYSLELHSPQICRSIRHKPNHAGRNLQRILA